MYPALLQPLRILQLLCNHPARIARGQTKIRQPGKLTHQSRLRNALCEKSFPHRSRSQCGIRQHLPGDPVATADDGHPFRHRLERLSLDEILDQSRQFDLLVVAEQTFRHIRMSDPPEKCCARSIVSVGMAQPQEIAVGVALTIPVLDGLVGNLVHRLFGVPRADSIPQTSTPATKVLGVLGEEEQMSCRAADSRDRSQSSLATLVISHSRRCSQGEDRRILARRTAFGGDLDDLFHQLYRILCSTTEYNFRVLSSEVLGVSVVGATLDTQCEESVEVLPVTGLEGIATGSILHLARISLLRLRMLTSANACQNICHDYTSTFFSLCPCWTKLFRVRERACLCQPICGVETASTAVDFILIID